MKHIHQIVAIILLLTAVWSCKDQKKQAEDQDAFYKTITQEYTLHENGAIDYRYSHVLDIYSYMAFNRQYGESFIVFNPKYQTLDVTRSTTIMANGKKVPSPDNAYNKVLPRFASGAPAFNHLREMVVTHTGLEPNSTIRFAYKLHSEAGYKPFLEDVTHFAQSAPVGNYHFKVKVPQDTKLHYKKVASSVKPKVTEEDGFRVYTWHLEDIPAQSHAGHQPEEGHIPGVVFSTAGLKQSLQYLQKQMNSGLSASIREHARSCSSDNKMQTIEKVKDIVVDGMNTYPIPFAHTRYQTRGHKKVWQANGGTPCEKAALMSAMLKEAGVQANPVIAIPDSLYAKNTGALNSISKVLVEAHVDSPNPVLIDPTENHSENLWYKYGHYTLIPMAKTNTSFRTLSKPQQASEVSMQLQGTLTEAMQVQGSTNIKVSGAAKPFFGFRPNAKALKSLYPLPSKFLSNVNQKTGDNGGYSIQAKISGKIPHNKQQHYFFIQLPESNRGMANLHIRNIPESRTVPYHIAFPVKEHYHIKLQLPKDMRLVNNKSRTLDNKAGKLKIAFEQQGDTLSVLRSIHIPQKTICRNVVQDFAQLVNSWNKQELKQIILKQKETL